MGGYTELSEKDVAKGVSTKYDLMSSIQHDGPADTGSYRAFVHFKANDQWYELQDLHCNGVHPQLISVSESYIQFYDAATSVPAAQPQSQPSDGAQAVGGPAP